MALYQRIVVSTGAHVGNPGPLPEALAGLADNSLANLPAALAASAVAQLGLDDTGFLPVADPRPPAPPPVRVIARIDFMRRFTLSEQLGIQSSTDPVVKNFLFMLGLVSDVDLDNSDTTNGVGYLEQHALIGAGRAAQVLA